MTYFESFEEECGPAAPYARVSQEAVDRYRDTLPAALLEYWQARGWCSYLDGFLWLVNPDDFIESVQAWVEPGTGPAIVFARTAFADLFVWYEGNVHFLNVHRDRMDDITDDIEIFFDGILPDQEYLDKGLMADLFRKAQPKLGTPGPDECYAFVPALALGGREDVKSLQRVKLQEQLALLAQLRD